MSTRENNINHNPSGRKRQIRRLKDQKPTDRIIVSELGKDVTPSEDMHPGDYAVLKLNFKRADLTPGRRIVVRDESRFVITEYDAATVEYSEIKALVMRIDRSVWEHGRENEQDDDFWPEVIGDE